jgi:hypothetical protein
MFLVIARRDSLLAARNGTEPRRESAPSANVRAARALLALCAGVTVLIGCPLYSDDCGDRGDCASGFYCDPSSQRCRPLVDELACSRPEQCELGETCTPEFTCRPGSCDYHGCVAGYRCGVVDSAHACVPIETEPGPADAAVLAPADGGDAAAEPGDAGLDGGAGDAAVEDASISAS